MDRVKFAIYETPANEIQGKQPCARLVSNGTKRTYYTANNDIKQFEEEGCLESDGYRTHRIYQLTAAGKEEMDKIPTPSEPLPDPLRMTGKLKL